MIQFYSQLVEWTVYNSDGLIYQISQQLFCLIYILLKKT